MIFFISSIWAVGVQLTWIGGDVATYLDPLGGCMDWVPWPREVGGAKSSDMKFLGAEFLGCTTRAHGRGRVTRIDVNKQYAVNMGVHLEPRRGG